MEHIKKTIEELKKVIKEKKRDLIEAQKMVNNLCKMINLPPTYVIKENDTEMSLFQLRGDEYYGKPLATVITGILEGRQIQGVGPATVREIYEQMTAGGYLFDAKSDSNAQRGIRISMTKNTKFHKLPTGKWGLTKWYPSIKEEKQEDVKEEVIISEVPKKRGRPRKKPLISESDQTENKQENTKE